MRAVVVLLPLVVVGIFWSGCSTSRDKRPPGATGSSEVRVDFADPVLNRRQILLFGLIDRPAAERTIQKLLFLDGQGQIPIDLYLQTPGGDLQHAIAIEQTMRLIQSPVNTCALSECNSAGALLLAGGTGRRRAFRGSVIVIHGLASQGNPPADYEKLVQEGYTRFWKTRARLPEGWLPLPPGALHVLAAEQALEYGIVDEVIGK